MREPIKAFTSRKKGGGKRRVSEEGKDSRGKTLRRISNGPIDPIAEKKGRVNVAAYEKRGCIYSNKKERGVYRESPNPSTIPSAKRIRELRGN